MSENKLRYIFHEFYSLLTNRRFILNILGIIAFLAIVLLAVFAWLRAYTNHGQKLELPSYVDQDVRSAMEDAEARSFNIIVNDSVHIVGKEGGIVQIQNPPGGSLVKENRKIYVTITKFQPDQIKLDDMRFFGEDFDQITAQLKTRSIRAEVKSTTFDPLTQNSVLEVWYQGKKIIDRRQDSKGLTVDKGDTLEFVISSNQGGSSEVPSLVGTKVSHADFILRPKGLNIAIEYSDNEPLPKNLEGDAVIVDQYPSEGTTLPRGSTITLKVKKPL